MKQSEKVCASCRARVDSNDRYCRVCGAIMNPVVSNNADRIMQCIYGPPPRKRKHTCVKCNYTWETVSMIDNQKYCPKCGGKAPGIDVANIFHK